MQSTQTPRTPAQMFAAVAGIFLLALGVLSLIFTDSAFSTVGGTTPGDFLIWNTTGWTAVMWIALGAGGVLSMVRVQSARSYALVAGVFFAVIAIWGFIDGEDVVTLFVANPVNNITHAVIACLGLALGTPSQTAQRRAAAGERDARFTAQHPGSGSAGHA